MCDLILGGGGGVHNKATDRDVRTGFFTRYRVFVSSQQAWCQVPSVPSALPGVTQLPVIRCQLPPCKVPDFKGNRCPLPPSRCHRTGNVSSTKIQDRSTPNGLPAVPALSLGTERGRQRVSLQGQQTMPAYVCPKRCQMSFPPVAAISQITALCGCQRVSSGAGRWQRQAGSPPGPVPAEPLEPGHA